MRHKWTDTNAKYTFHRGRKWKGVDSPIKNNILKNNSTVSQQMQKRIGNTNYVFSIRFSETSKETMEDKIFRLIKHEAKTLPLHVSESNVPQIPVTAGMEDL